MGKAAGEVLPFMTAECGPIAPSAPLAELTAHPLEAAAASTNSALIPLCPQPNIAQDEVPIPLTDDTGLPPLADTSSLSTQLIQKAPTIPPKQPFSRAELDELLKNVEDSPIPFFRRSIQLLQRQPKALTPVPKVVEVAPLAVLFPQAASHEISSDFESEDQSCSDEDLEVQSSYFHPLAPGRGRGKKKALIQSDRILRPRKKH